MIISFVPSLGVVSINFMYLYLLFDYTGEMHPPKDFNRREVELLPWEYPNLTFYVALSWLPITHAAMVVDGANAYSSMAVDVGALVLITNDASRRQGRRCSIYSCIHEQVLSVFELSKSLYL